MSVQPNVQPNVQPDVQPDVQPYVQPYVQPAVPVCSQNTQKTVVMSQVTNLMTFITQMAILGVIVFFSVQYIPSIPLSMRTKLFIALTVSIIYFLATLIAPAMASVTSSLCVMAC